MGHGYYSKNCSINDYVDNFHEAFEIHGFNDDSLFNDDNDTKEQEDNDDIDEIPYAQPQPIINSLQTPRTNEIIDK